MENSFPQDNHEVEENSTILQAESHILKQTAGHLETHSELERQKLRRGGGERKRQEGKEEFH